MATTTVSRTIEAPVEHVFDVVAHIENFAEAVPQITNVSFLAEQKKGVGTRFTETRVLKGREATTTLEVKEYVENERVRMVSDEGGTIWDTVFTVTALGGPAADGGAGTRLDMVMDARPYKTMAKIVNPLAKGIIKKAIEGDMDAIKAYCESPATTPTD